MINSLHATDRFTFHFLACGKTFRNIIHLSSIQRHVLNVQYLNVFFCVCLLLTTNKAIFIFSLQIALLIGRIQQNPLRINGMPLISLLYWLGNKVFRACGAIISMCNNYNHTHRLCSNSSKIDLITRIYNYPKLYQ